MENNKKPCGYWTKKKCHEEALKYETKSEFSKNVHGAYKAAFRNKWLNDICSHMKRGGVKWSFEICKKEALKYNTKVDFREKSSGAYSSAKRNKWLNDICSHMKILKESWTYDKVKSVASECTSKAYFMRKYNGAYSVARRNNWLNDICSHMEVVKNPNGYWTKERCQEEAIKYESKGEFQKNSGGAYTKACQEKWLNEICSHMIPQFRWDYESCKKEALKYESKGEFQKNSVSAYGASRKNKWLEEICSHMEILWSKKWDYNSCKKEALKYKTRSEFIKNASGAYSAAKKNNWYDKIVTHMIIQGSLKKRYIYVYEFKNNYAYVGLTYNIKERRNAHEHIDSKSPVYKHIKKYNLSKNDFIFKILGYYEKDYASQKEIKSIEQYKNKNWKLINKMSGGGLGGSLIKWTFEKCKKEALLYNNRTEFDRGSRGAYSSAKKNGWLDEICSHMEYIIRPTGYWTKEKCTETALKYNTKQEFRENNGGAYAKSREEGWLDEICSHMINGRLKWTYLKCEKEASKYNKKVDFKNNSNSAYNSAKNNGWLEEICSHMTKRFIWTYDKVKNEALKYKKRSELQKYKGGAYRVAHKNNWLDEFFPIP